MHRILVHADYYLPGYKGGGPIRTLVNMVEWLGDTFEFLILTRDRDLGDTQPYADVKPGTWTRQGAAQVRYLTPAEQTPLGLRQVLHSIDYDMLYLNSFFNVLSVKLMWLHWLGIVGRRPVIIAPRNEFYAGALAQKPVKKQAYLRLVRSAGVYRKVFWQASTEQERGTILRLFPAATDRCMVAYNLSAKQLPTVPQAPPREPDSPLRIIFLSRLSRKKNLMGALDVLARVTVPVIFDIYGPKEDMAYWRECAAKLETLPAHIQARYCGPVTPEQVLETFARYDLFLFPTLSENYGHVIWESLYAGCAPLISDRTPWHELEKNGVGWVVPLDHQEQMASVIDTAARTHDEDRRERARVYAAAVAQDSTVVEANRQLFLRALGGT